MLAALFSLLLRENCVANDSERERERKTCMQTESIAINFIAIYAYLLQLPLFICTAMRVKESIALSWFTFEPRLQLLASNCESESTRRLAGNLFYTRCYLGHLAVPAAAARPTPVHDFELITPFVAACCLGRPHATCGSQRKDPQKSLQNKIK